MKDWHVNGCLNRQRANGQTNKQTRRVKARDWLKIGAAIQVQSLLLRSREIIESSAREREREATASATTTRRRFVLSGYILTSVAVLAHLLIASVPPLTTRIAAVFSRVEPSKTFSISLARLISELD